MPIYDYLCDTCGHRFDVRQSFSADPVSDCTECGAPVRRVLHPAGVIFKGSGWYITDSRKGPSDSKATGDGKAAKDSGTSETSEKSKDAPSSESKSSEAKPVSSKKEPAASAASD
jgi:putative FmdB family regulatory protein